MKHLKGIFILMLIAGIGLAMAALLFADMVDARADFVKWSNRSARVLEPAHYNTNGTCSEGICSWKGVQGVGNMGIGDGNVSLMDPDVLNDLVTGSKQAIPASNETAGNSTKETAPAGNSSSNGTLVATNNDALPAVPETPAEGPLTETLLPDNDLAASVIPRGVPYSITVNQPFAHILAEDPVEASVLYGKLLGFPLPGGQVVDVGIKCLGYEY